MEHPENWSDLELTDCAIAIGYHISWWRKHLRAHRARFAMPAEHRERARQALLRMIMKHAAEVEAVRLYVEAQP